MRCVLILPAAALCLGCSSDGDPTFGNSATTGGQVCIPGQQLACTCPSGDDGAQTCKADGSGLDPCVCGQGGGGAGAAGGSGTAGQGQGGSACDPGASQPCYSGPAGTEGVGLCVPGAETCNPDGTAFGPCTGEVTPVRETCSTPGDDDCDGQTNEGGPGCACNPGAQVACYSGPPVTQGVGPCIGGSQVCNAQGTGFGPCIGEITPLLETCNTPEDDDCDGATNEDGAGCVCVPTSTTACYDGPNGTENVGVCKGGTKTCNVQGNGYGPCVGQIVPSPDLCGTVNDEDCNASPQPCVPSSTWSKVFPSTGPMSIRHIAVDAQGNVVVAGPLKGTTNLGGGALVASTSEEMFAAKFDPAGTHLWSKKFGTQTQFGQHANGLALDPQGNAFLVGDFEGTIDFGGGALMALGPRDLFVVKLDVFGNHVWSKRFGDFGQNDHALDVAADPAGDVIVVGFFQNQISFGGPTFIGTANGHGTFIAKLAGADGSHLWSEHVGAAAQPMAVTTDPIGNVRWTGGFNDLMDFGGGQVAPMSLSSADIFLVELTPAGGYVWLKEYAGLNGDEPRAIALDPGGSIFLAGKYNQNLDFGGGPLPVGSGDNGFVAKLDAVGDHVFSKAFYGPGMVETWGVATNAAGDSFVTGAFYGAVEFGGGQIVSPMSGMAAFLVRHTLAGGLTSVDQYGGDTQAHAIATDAGGSPHIGGAHFSGTLDFGDGPLPPGPGAFLAKLAP